MTRSARRSSSCRGRRSRRRFGSSGIRSFASAYGGKGRITDDTQMTLFTAEGLIRAEHRLTDQGLANVDAVVHRAYLRWLSTQVRDTRDVPGIPSSGWTPRAGCSPRSSSTRSGRQEPPAWVRSRSGKMGAPDEPLNDSKGCGGVMRVAPVGLVATDPFDLGCRAAAITHGHPSGWLAAGAFAQIIAAVIHRDSIRGAAEAARERCRSQDGGSEVARALEATLTLVDEGKTPTPERVELLGGGWVAEEALAISVYSALSATSPADAMANTVNHGGDSDSTGSITGNILGAALGTDWLDAELLGELEGCSVIEQLAGDLYDAFNDDSGFGITSDRYPPW